MDYRNENVIGDYLWFRVYLGNRNREKSLFLFESSDFRDLLSKPLL